MNPKHLLLGLVLANDDETARVLSKHGIEIEGVRVALIETLAEWRKIPPTSQSIG